MTAFAPLAGGKRTSASGSPNAIYERTLRERCHRGLACRLVAVCAVVVLPVRDPLSGAPAFEM